jgi:DNA polymerase (family 10)
VLAEHTNHALEILALVIRRQADERSHARIIAVVATTLPRNADVAEQLELLADLLEIEGEAAFRVLAYRRAASRVRDTGTPVAQLALDGKAKELPGIGATIQDKIVQIVDTGEIEALSKRRKTIPPEVVEFLRIPGLGPKTVRKIWQELGVTTLVELKTAAREQRLRTLPGLGAKVEENILKSVGRKKKATGPPRALLGRALPALLAAVEEVREHPACERVSEAGSARRRKETVRDLDIIATASDPAALIDHFTKLPWVAEVAAKGSTKATVVSHEGLRFDLRVVPPECYGNLLQHFTGSKDHNVAMREDAVRRGLSISEYGVTEVESGEMFTATTEEELYEHLGYAYIPPELRENGGELEAARAGQLPELVELKQLRGDLHTHSHWSADGKNTLTEMVTAANARGYAYYAITDHSHYLREGRMEQQAKEIDSLAKKVAPLRLLKGVEVNIKADGTLDVSDEELAARDWVVASIHTAFQRDPTERVLATMDNPNVNCIGHLTGRKLSRREPMDIDVERVVERAVETGTFLEINSQPDRLDLSDVNARLAGEAGVKIVVSSDAHQIAALDYVEFGIAQARRAWLTADQVVNTRTWAQLKKLMKK